MQRQGGPGMSVIAARRAGGSHNRAEPVMNSKSSAGGPRGHPQASRKLPSRYASGDSGEVEASRIARHYLAKLKQPQPAGTDLVAGGHGRPSSWLAVLLGGLRRLLATPVHLLLWRRRRAFFRHRPGH